MSRWIEAKKISPPHVARWVDQQLDARWHLDTRRWVARTVYAWCEQQYVDGLDDTCTWLMSDEVDRVAKC
jgi:hypothetical protein